MKQILSERLTNPVSGLKSVLPGLLLAFITAVVSKLLGLLLPQLGGATLAILLGIVLGNTLFRQSRFEVGTKFAEGRLLEISVVLLGGTLTVQTISGLGFKSFLFVLLQMTGTIIFAYLLGRILKFNQSMSLMMAGGNAVCGSSAIASIAPSIEAKDKEKGQIITLVNLLGTIMMLVLPLLSKALFQDSALRSSALLGGTLQSVGQVVGAASMLNETVVQYAMIFKLMRVMMIVIVVILFEKFYRHTEGQASQTEVKGKKKGFKLTWSIGGFLIICLLNSTVQIPTVLEQGAHTCSTWLETTALAAIGLRLDLKKFLKEGPRFLVYGLGVGVFQTIAALLLVLLFIS